MTVDIERTWLSALSFEEYRAQLQVHAEIFAEHYERLAFVCGGGEPPFPPIRILILTEAWCPDSVLNVPLIARLAEASSGAELRIAGRDDNRALADSFPGRGGVSRLPTVIFLAGPHQILGHWSERCRRDHQWMVDFMVYDPFPALHLEDGRPGPPLAAWIERRFAAQRPLYEAERWRDVRDELRAILGMKNPKVAKEPYEI